MKEKISWILVVIITALSLLSLTALHDPILHGAMAYINGWDVTGYGIDVFTGYTNTTMTQEVFDNTSTIQVWLFYMLPALLLFFGALLVVILHPNWITGILATAIMFLNFASLVPSLPGSDSAQAFTFLVSRGMSPLLANTIQWGIFIMALIAFGTMIYIIHENNPKDSENRVKQIINPPKRGKK